MPASDALTSITEQLPGSISIDGVPSNVATWTREDLGRGPRAGGVDETEFSLGHPSGLTMLVTLIHHGANAVEWQAQLRNDSDNDSGVLTHLHTLDHTWTTAEKQPPVLSTTNGSLCQLDDFLPWNQPIELNESVQLQPVGGRSSDGAMPFFTLTWGSVSLGVAVGWSGQWLVDITRAGRSARIRAGLAHTHLRLHPCEVITLPSILVVAVEGPADHAANALRGVLERSVIPHGENGSPVTPLAHMTMATFHVTKQVSEASELAAVARAAELGLEAFWIDACWYGDTPQWSEQVGNWHVRSDAFPRGLRPISDAAHAAGMKFVLWIEPERARLGTRLVNEHPELFLRFPDDEPNVLLDLGNLKARETVLELISGYIDEFAVDIYRQDFNIRPLSAWQAADAADREGIHEIRHVEGLYWLWDSLIQRHPGLVIDNCASGGRRIDLETMRRSVPLWRSDSADVGGGAAGENVPLANQIQVSGLSRFVTQHTGPVWAFDPYHIRSAISTGFVVYCPLPDTEAKSAELVAAVNEVKRLRPMLRGDFHSLVEPSEDPSAWSGSQFHRPQSHDGVAVILRRPESPESAVRIQLQGLDPNRRYRVSQSLDYRLGESVEMDGTQLRELSVSIPNAPGAVLVEYACAD